MTFFLEPAGVKEGSAKWGITLLVCENDSFHGLCVGRIGFLMVPNWRSGDGPATNVKDWEACQQRDLKAGAES